MRVDDYFVDDPSSPSDGALNFDLLGQLRAGQLRAGPLRGHPDLEAAIALAQLLDEQFLLYGTDSTQTITDAGAFRSTRHLRHRDAQPPSHLRTMWPRHMVAGRSSRGEFN
jgi:hypothetical protein